MKLVDRIEFLEAMEFEAQRCKQLGYVVDVVKQAFFLIDEDLTNDIHKEPRRRILRAMSRPEVLYAVILEALGFSLFQQNVDTEILADYYKGKVDHAANELAEVYEFIEAFKRKS